MKTKTNESKERNATQDALFAAAKASSFLAQVCADAEKTLLKLEIYFNQKAKECSK